MYVHVRTLPFFRFIHCLIDATPFLLSLLHLSAVVAAGRKRQLFFVIHLQQDSLTFKKKKIIFQAFFYFFLWVECLLCPISNLLKPSLARKREQTQGMSYPVRCPAPPTSLWSDAKIYCREKGTPCNDTERARSRTDITQEGTHTK